MDKNKLTIQIYYECMGDKIKAPLLNILHEDLIFKSNYGNYTDRDIMLDSIWPYVGTNKAYDIKILKREAHYLVNYNLINKENETVLARITEEITFRNDRISQIEVVLINRN